MYAIRSYYAGRADTALLLLIIYEVLRPKALALIALVRPAVLLGRGIKGGYMLLNRRGPRLA